MISSILRPIREQGALFTFLVLMSCVVIPVMCYTTGAFPKPFVFSLPIFDCYLITVVAFWLRRIHLSWFVWIACFLLLGGEVLSLLCYQSPYSMTVLQLLLETHVRETTEFLQGHGVALQFGLATAITAACLAASILINSKLINSKFLDSLVPPAPELCEEPRRTDKVRSKNKGGSKFFTLHSTFFILLVLSACCQSYSYFRLYQAYTADVTTTIAENKYMPLRNSPFVRFLYGHALNVVSTKELGKLVHTVRQTEVDSCSYRSPIILLLIGESYNKYHSPIYNPEARQTTPNLCRMEAQGNLIVYDDVVSPYNVTSKTFRHMFSTYYPGCGREWVDCTLFPAVFRKAGYRVWFITNHYAGEENNKEHHDHAGGTIFNQRELRQLQFSHMNTEAARYDMELLSQLPPADTLAAQPSLLIFHMMGQHEDYCERYPGAYSHFTADSIRQWSMDNGRCRMYNEQWTMDADGRQIVAEYDNATLYNDAVVGKLFEMYASQDVVALYLSDHGEEIYDWRNSYFRTNSDYMKPEIARYQYEIPFLFYVSDTFKDRHPDLLCEIQTARSKPFIVTMLPFALFHLAGISHADYKPSLDILSPEYDESYPRIIREDVDYDELMKGDSL
ncbi:MAG: phosphoethanolamine transferase [Bacteroidaceae bacterium]|nr:phosphoethanolamine transferase [Bacteroidaceae bacterium]